MSAPAWRYRRAAPPPFGWTGPADALAFAPEAIVETLLELDRPLYAVLEGGRVGVTCEGELSTAAVGGADRPCCAALPALPAGELGDAAFREAHGAAYAYQAGAMANGISGEALVTALGGAGFLASFGAAGLPPDRVLAAVRRVREALPRGPWAFNLIHSPSEPAHEEAVVALYLREGVRTVEASAYLDLTPAVVRYRAAGVRALPDGSTVCDNRVIAKLSRPEVARRFMAPPPDALLRALVARGDLTEAQARLAATVPMADDVTVEADSGGHTDNRPLVGLLPAMIALRDRLRDQHGIPREIRVGAAGGLGTPAGVLAAFTMGAAYVVTGSVNQGTLEAATSDAAKRALAGAEMADVIMAPAADMFEMGVEVQVLKRGTMYPMRARKLYELYRAHGALEEIPAGERGKIERFFQKDLDAVWADTVDYFRAFDPGQIERAETDPRRRMALTFRWYLGQSSKWAILGDGARALDYQLWCGPAMGAFNEWVKGSYLEAPERRSVVDVARHLMRGAAYLSRVRALEQAGVEVPSRARSYTPEPFLETAHEAALV